MKLKWVVLFSLGVVSLATNADQSTVINAQAIGDQPAASTNAPAQAATPNKIPAEANRPQLREGARISLREKTALAKAALGDNNLQQGDTFLAANKVKPGVVTLPSGVQYKILSASKGKKPTENSLIKCRYQGKLIDGTVIDRTDETKPAELNVTGFIPGLKEAIKLMPSGSKWQIVIPPQLAYGDKGNRGVGPNAVLIYDMQIISIK